MSNGNNIEDDGGVSNTGSLCTSHALRNEKGSADVRDQTGSTCSLSGIQPSLTIDIIDTSIIHPAGPRTSFVVYSVQLHPSRTGASPDECYNDCIERRYTDFQGLNKTLRQIYPAIMTNLVFPKKLYSGNFSPENISRRSQAFEQYLCHLLDIPEIRYSRSFMDFFYTKELKGGIKDFHKLRYSMAICKMSKATRTMELILSPIHTLVAFAYATMAACHSSLDDYFECYESAMKAIESVPSDCENPLLLPLLIKAVHMAVSLGKDKRHLEQRISNMQSKLDTPIEVIPSLHEVLLNEMDKILSRHHKR